MIGVILIVIGIWGVAWGVYSTFVAKDKKRRITAAVTAPIGLFLFYYGLLSLFASGMVL
jgi:hypothetical protein